MASQSKEAEKHKQRHATKAQLAHRSRWLRLEALEEVRHISGALDGCHQAGLRNAARDTGAALVDAMAEAGL